jgi:XTP/dITP diphosphohydrolase
MPKELVIASGNMHKVREIRAILAETEGFEFLTLRAFPDYVPLLEEGMSLEQSVSSKARHAASALNQIVLADSSALIVPALTGQLGVGSFLDAGAQATDREKRQKLLRAMRILGEEQRHAYYVCAIAIATPGGDVWVEQAQCEGRVLTEERGSHGYGYDPLFAKHHYARTFGELDEATKNRISHRRKALDKIRPHLQALR